MYKTIILDCQTKKTITCCDDCSASKTCTIRKNTSSRASEDLIVIDL